VSVLDELFTVPNADEAGRIPSDERVVFVPGPTLATCAQENWTPVVKRPSVVYMRRLMIPFEVETPHGVVTGRPGDVVAHDPVSGEFWPVNAAFVERWYTPLPGETNMGDAYSG